uniref:Uncharacterized protein n=1 Tax=Globodera rostochiensis TaxID=31243 RepID=A0A914GYH4_GLORO
MGRMHHRPAIADRLINRLQQNASAHVLPSYLTRSRKLCRVRINPALRPLNNTLSRIFEVSSWTMLPDHANR